MTTTTAVGVLATAQKLADIRDFQERERGLVGRRTEMHTLHIALAAKLHVILFGKSGVAKSMTVDGLLEHMPHLSKFKTQAYKASPPEQFLGPISLKSMADDILKRIIAGKLPAVEVGIIDELTRAPRAILPAFQGMMVEREFDSGDGVQPVPLQSLIGAVNHIPQDEELAAFLDRFALKLVVKGPQSQDQFVQILKGGIKRDAFGPTAIPDELIVGKQEWSDFQEFVTQVRVPDSILDRFGELWVNLLGIGIEPSPRRYREVTKAMRALAALDGRDECTEDDLQVAQHAMWTNEEEVAPVYAEVVKFASEWVKERAILLDSFAETLDRLGQIQALVAGGADTSSQAEIDDEEKSITDHGLKVVNTQRKLAKLVEKHIASATGQDVSELTAVLTQIDAAREWVSDRLLGGLTI